MTKNNELLFRILNKAKNEKASDIHFSTNNFIFFRIDGDITPIEEFKILSVNDIATLISPIMTENAKKKFENEKQVDFAFTGQNEMRYRVNVYRTINGISVAFREINNNIRSLDDLGVPEILKKFAKLKKGLVIISGPAGSGKSTTLAAVIDFINKHFKKHIITIEDPVEFIHKPNLSLIDQREIGKNAKSFASALKGALREDPDIIMVGEMRDPKTIEMALTAAETGHLVFATLHTLSAAKTIDRIINACDNSEKDVIRTILSTSLQGVILQTLLKRKEGKGRVAAFEIMIATDAVKNLIREDRVFQIDSIIQTGQKYGMITMKDYIQNLLAKDIIDDIEARKILMTLKEEQIERKNK
jgi:twitching motility protein PilT